LAKCKSWFKRNVEDGRVVALWPGATIHAKIVLENIRGEDFAYEYLECLGSNRLAWMGNGTTVAQMSGADTTEYLVKAEIPTPIVEGINVWEEPQEPRESTNGIKKALDEIPGGTAVGL
jgi:hypothetical protein